MLGLSAVTEVELYICIYIYIKVLRVRFKCSYRGRIKSNYVDLKKKNPSKFNNFMSRSLQN